MKRWVSRIVKTVIFVVFGVMLFLVGAFVVLPKFMGWMPLAVLTGSMRPTWPPGTEMVIDPIQGQAELDALEVGDVVTYMPKSGDSDVITHRIIAISKGLDGHRSFTFKGDNNPSADPKAVTEEQIRGKLLYSVPLLGYVTTKLPINQKGWGMVAIAVGLFGYAAWQIIGGVLSVLRGRRSGKDIAPTTAETAVPATALEATEATAGWILPEDLPQVRRRAIRYNGWILPEDLPVLPAPRRELETALVA